MFLGLVFEVDVIFNRLFLNLFFFVFVVDKIVYKSLLGLMWKKKKNIVVEKVFELV